MLKRFGVAAVSHRLSRALYRSGEWARGRRGLGRASNGAPQTGQGAHEQMRFDFLRTQPALQQFSSSLAVVW